MENISISKYIIIEKLPTCGQGQKVQAADTLNVGTHIKSDDEEIYKSIKFKWVFQLLDSMSIQMIKQAELKTITTSKETLLSQLKENNQNFMCLIFLHLNYYPYTIHLNYQMDSLKFCVKCSH